MEGIGPQLLTTFVILLLGAPTTSPNESSIWPLAVPKILIFRACVVKKPGSAYACRCICRYRYVVIFNSRHIISMNLWLPYLMCPIHEKYEYLSACVCVWMQIEFLSSIHFTRSILKTKSSPTKIPAYKESWESIPHPSPLTPPPKKKNRKALLVGGFNPSEKYWSKYGWK